MRRTRQNRRGKITGGLLLAVTLCFATAAMPLELTFPGPAEATANRTEELTSLRLPTGPFANNILPTMLREGALQMTAYRVELSKPSTLELMQPLRSQIEAAGFAISFECETLVCGGYDFRYGTEVLPEPDMHVDLGDFRYLAASGANSEQIAVLVSRSGLTGFVQVTQIGGQAPVLQAKAVAAAPKPTAAPIPARTDPPTQKGLPFLAGLEAGHAQVLEDLVFASGSSALAAGRYGSLAGLAAWLEADAQRRIILVGHTDASGTLEGNVKLSKLRAESVRQELLRSYKVAPEQVQAEGIGFLSPRASNLTPEGRDKNRRVEVMATSTELLAP